MAKAFGILLIVLGVWIGMEIFTKGSDEAFGGIFAAGGERATGSESSLGGERATRVPAEPPVQRIRARVQQSIKAGAARSTGGFGDDSPDEVPADEDGASDEYGSEE